jgi:hypothetical protein
MKIYKLLVPMAVLALAVAACSVGGTSVDANGTGVIISPSGGGSPVTIPYPTNQELTIQCNAGNQTACIERNSIAVGCLLANQMTEMAACMIFGYPVNPPTPTPAPTPKPSPKPKPTATATPTMIVTPVPSAISTVVSPANNNG